MTFADLFDQYWWLIFPIFGMTMGFWGMVSNERRSRSMMEVMKSYVEQGKEPPPDLVRMVTQSMDEYGVHSPSSQANRRAEGVWTVVTFAALAAGFAVAYVFNQGEDWSWVFLAVTVAMAVTAIGGLLVLFLGRKS